MPGATTTSAESVKAKAQDAVYVARKSRSKQSLHNNKIVINFMSEVLLHSDEVDLVQTVPGSSTFPLRRLKDHVEKKSVCRTSPSYELRTRTF